MTGEFGLISQITTDLPTNPHVTLGAGDDAAALRLEGEAVISTDVLVEHVHFKRQWSSAEQIGRKAVAVNISDIESMGAKPVAIVCALAFPKDLDEQWVLEFSRGVKDECAQAGVALVGGDISTASVIVAGVTALGDMQGRQPVTRAGARAGDVVAVRGRLGWSGAGLAALMRGFRSPLDVVHAALCPEVPYGQGRVACDAGATAMMDISDGLVQDLGHMARASRVGIDLHRAALEVAEPMERVGAATGKDPLGFVLHGGEDYALVATFPSEGSLPKGWRVIGEVVQGEGVTVDGAECDAEGWDHLA